LISVVHCPVPARLSKMLDFLTSISLRDALLALLLLKGLDCVRLGYNFFLRGGKNLKNYGEWAVVTGATDGIGKAYAFELAKKGLNVFLLSRTEQKLTELQEEIKAKYPKIEVAHLAVDYSKFDQAARTSVKARLKNLDIGMLINNVGMSYPFTKFFHELKEEEIADILEVNMASTTWMTRIVLGDIDDELKPVDGMLKRKRGCIINTSSGGGRSPSPLLAEYSGAKAYVEMFSKGLTAELAPKGIHVQCQTPLFVTTKMSKIRRASLTVPSAEAYVKCAVAQIGYGNVISPHWSHSLQLWAMAMLPEFASILLVSSMHHSIRSKGIKKEKKEKGEKKE